MKELKFVVTYETTKEDDLTDNELHMAMKRIGRNITVITHFTPPV